MNSMPADSYADMIALRLPLRDLGIPEAASYRLIVASPTPDRCANSRTGHPKADLAARSCAEVASLACIVILLVSYDWHEPKS